MDHTWKKKESDGHAFIASADAYKQRCYTFLFVLCNDKDLQQAGKYLAPDCVLVHEDNPPVKGAIAFLTTWGKMLKALPEYYKDMEDMMVEIGREPNAVARVWVYSRISGIKQGVVRDSIDMMRFTHDGLFLFSKDVQRDTTPN